MRRGEAGRSRRWHQKQETPACRLYRDERAKRPDDVRQKTAAVVWMSCRKHWWNTTVGRREKCRTWMDRYVMTASLKEIRSSELVRLLRLQRWFCVAYHRGRSWTDTVLVVHCWLATAYWGPQSLPSPVCRWHPSLWALLSVCNAGASEQHLYLHRWCGQVNALQPAPAEYCKNRSSLVYIQSASICYLNHQSE